MTTASQTCAGCSQEKPVGDFYKQGTRLRSRCKTCYAQHNREMRAKHAEQRSAYEAGRGSGWERSGREKYEPSEQEKFFAYIARTYRLTQERYEELLVQQNGVCAICQKGCNRSTTARLCVDHDHTTGAVRGLLCFKCNTGLGRFEDDVILIDRAIGYLRTASRARERSIFLCGPMSGLPESNYPAFNLVARRLRLEGYRVENPAENPEPLGARWEDYMRLSIRQLVTCESIALLPGWDKSRGATLEAHIAHALGMRPIYLTTEAAAVLPQKP